MEWSSYFSSGVALAPWMLFPMRRRGPPFIGGKEWVLGIFPIPIWKDQNAILHIDVTTIPTWTDHGKAVRGSLPNMGWLGPGSTMSEPKLAHLRWVDSFGPLEWVYVGVLRRWGNLIWVYPCSPLVWALFCLVVGLSPLGLCRMVFVLCFLAHF